MQMYDPVVICVTCSETGHTTASCHYTKAEYMSDMTYEDEVFWSYVDPRDRPESLREDESDEVVGGSPNYPEVESDEDSDMEGDSEQSVDTDMLEDSCESNDDMEVEAETIEEEGVGNEVDQSSYNESNLYGSSESDSDANMYD